jgi:hypothetical protein
MSAAAELEEYIAALEIFLQCEAPGGEDERRRAEKELAEARTELRQLLDGERELANVEKDDSWADDVVALAENAATEHDAAEVMVEIMIEHAIWDNNVDDARVRGILTRKFGSDGWKRIMQAAEVMVKREFD